MNLKKNRFKSSRLLIRNPKMYSPPSLREHLHFLGQERCIFYYSKKIFNLLHVNHYLQKQPKKLIG